MAAVFNDERPRFVIVDACADRVHMRAAPWYATALDELEPREAEALIALRLHELGRHVAGMIDMVAAGIRRRAMRRELAKRARRLKTLRRAIDAALGGTRPITELGQLCGFLAERGFGATEIVRLLDAAGIESRGDLDAISPDAARQRVQARIKRARRRSRRSRRRRA